LSFVRRAKLRLRHGERYPSRGRPQVGFCQDDTLPGATPVAWVVAATGGRGTTGWFTVAAWRAAQIVAVDGPGPNRTAHPGAVRAARVVAAAIVTEAGSEVGTWRRPIFVFLL
jgi:hypothetical protein